MALIEGKQPIAVVPQTQAVDRVCSRPVYGSVRVYRGGKEHCDHVARIVLFVAKEQRIIRQSYSVRGGGSRSVYRVREDSTNDKGVDVPKLGFRSCKGRHRAESTGPESRGSLERRLMKFGR